MFRSRIGKKEVIIDDNTNQEVFKIFRRGLRKRDFNKHPYGNTPFLSRFSMPLIPRSEWKERIQELEDTKTRLSDLLDGISVLNQSRTNYCWFNSPTFAVMAIRRVAGLADIRLSPASGASKITNFRNVGGWGTEALKFIIQYGIVPQSLWPANAIDRRYDTTEAWEEAKKYRVYEWDDMTPRNIDELFTCLLNRMPVSIGLNWWRHQVTAVDPVVLDNGSFGIRIANSWGEEWGENGYGILTGNRMIPDDQCVPRVSFA